MLSRFKLYQHLATTLTIHLLKQNYAVSHGNTVCAV
jgi:hypothetical protein